MVRTMPIHEVKDRLSRVIAELSETSDEIQITKHGRVVAVLTGPPAVAVVLGAGSRPGAAVPDLEDLRWSADELRDFDGDVLPS